MSSLDIGDFLINCSNMIDWLIDWLIFFRPGGQG
jgi:hypothetical protein